MDFGHVMVKDPLLLFRSEGGLINKLGEGGIVVLWDHGVFLRLLRILLRFATFGDSSDRWVDGTEGRSRFSVL